MKTILLLLLISYSTFGQAQSKDDNKKRLENVLIGLRSYVNELKMDSLLPARNMDSLEASASNLINLLNNSRKVPDTSYIRTLEINRNQLKSVAHDKFSKATKITIVKNVARDLDIKGHFITTALNTAEDEYIFYVNVEVTTRQITGGKFKTVNGYRIYANPWVVAKQRPSIFRFTNSTNPSTNYMLPPGRYFIWAVAIGDEKRFFPTKVEPTIIGSSGKSEKIFIDILR